MWQVKRRGNKEKMTEIGLKWAKFSQKIMARAQTGKGHRRVAMEGFE
jgi:hypothetical protein